MPPTAIEHENQTQYSLLTRIKGKGAEYSAPFPFMVLFSDQYYWLVVVFTVDDGAQLRSHIKPINTGGYRSYPRQNRQRQNHCESRAAQDHTSELQSRGHLV